jgi:hypothetical protein
MSLSVFETMTPVPFAFDWSPCESFSCLPN